MWANRDGSVYQCIWRKKNKKKTKTTLDTPAPAREMFSGIDCSTLNPEHNYLLSQLVLTLHRSEVYVFVTAWTTMNKLYCITAMTFFSLFVHRYINLGVLISVSFGYCYGVVVNEHK